VIAENAGRWWQQIVRYFEPVFASFEAVFFAMEIDGLPYKQAPDFCHLEKKSVGKVSGPTSFC
jgi:hypothetical protein